MLSQILHAGFFSPRRFADEPAVSGSWPRKEALSRHPRRWKLPAAAATSTYEVISTPRQKAAMAAQLTPVGYAATALLPGKALFSARESERESERESACESERESARESEREKDSFSAEYYRGKSRSNKSFSPSNPANPSNPS